MKHEIFAAYHAKFFNNTVAKKIKKKKVTARYTQSMKDAELAKHVIASIRNIEKDKLYYFMLCESNPQSVIVVKSPTKTAETKKFLGYEWSNRKGSEGIKYLGAVVEDEDNEIATNKGIQQIETPLFDPHNLFNDEKINTLIRKNYLGEDVDVPEGIGENVNSYNLQDMIEFTKVELDKLIKTNVDYKINIDSKYPITTIDEIANLNEFTYNPTTTNKNYKYVDISSVSNGNINYSSIIKGTEAPSRARRIAKKDSVLISTVRPNLRAFAYVEDEVEDSIYSTGFAILRTKDQMTLLPRYLYYMFMNYKFTMMQIKAMMPKGMYPSINANNIKSIRIPLPPIDIQKKIADECKKVDDKVVVALDELSSSQEGLTSLLNSISSNEVRLESICYVKGGKRIPKGMGYSASETNHPYLRVSDFKDGSIDTSDMHYVSDSVFEHIKNYTISVDDVYISIAGTIVLVGIITTILDGANLTENAAKMIIKDHNLLIKEYLYLVFNSSRVQMQIEAETKSIGVPKLALHRIESLLIPYIEKNKQEEIVKKAAPFIKTIARAKYIIQQAASHKQAIIDKYLK